MGKEFSFSSDYIEITTGTYDTLLFTPVYSKELGLYLCKEDDKPIKDITLINSRLIIRYLDGGRQLLDDIIISIEVQDKYFKRKTKSSINNSLFIYSLNDALFYDLEEKKAFDYEMIRKHAKKRVK